MTLQKYLCRPAWQARVGRRTNGALVLQQPFLSSQRETRERETCVDLPCNKVKRDDQPKAARRD